MKFALNRRSDKAAKFCAENGCLAGGVLHRRIRAWATVQRSCQQELPSTKNSPPAKNSTLPGALGNLCISAYCLRLVQRKQSK